MSGPFQKGITTLVTHTQLASFVATLHLLIFQLHPQSWISSLQKILYQLAGYYCTIIVLATIISGRSS